jgi:outer membrane protein OmpA-like peptidoglycan-associated protein
MKTHLLLTVFFVALSVLLHAQPANPKAGETPLSKFKNIEEAKTAFDKGLQGADRDKVWANYGLSFYFVQKNNLDAAFAAADTAAKMFPLLKEKAQTSLIEEKISLAQIRTQVDKIIKSAFEKAKSTKTFDSWDNFLTHFPKPAYASGVQKYYTEAIYSRGIFVCDRLKEENNAAALQTLLTRYEADLKKVDLECFNAGNARLLGMQFAGRPWSELPDFFKKNPKHPLSKDTTRTAFITAIMTQKTSKIQRFVDTYPKSGFFAIAQDSAMSGLYPDIVRRNDMMLMLQYYTLLPNTKHLAEIDGFFASNVKNRQSAAFFEDKSVDISKLPLTQQALYDIYRYYGSTETLALFEERYPQNSLKTTIENDKKAFALRDVEGQEAEYFTQAGDTYMAFQKLQQIIKADLKNKKWALAKEKILKYAPNFPKNNPFVASLIEVLDRPLSNTKTEPLSISVNTAMNNEYCPVISADNRTLYFCRKTNQEDVFSSRRDDKGDWEKNAVCKGLDSYENEAPLALSADGNMLLIFRAGKLYFSEKTAEGTWAPGKILPPNINSATWQGESTLSADGKILIFESVNREETVGLRAASTSSFFSSSKENIDFFISFKTGENEWSKAVNLSTIINTPFVERSPFLHPDMRTLYFCSAGHGGLGDLDLFKTTRLDSTWLNWSTPVHVGKELNSVGQDWGYKVSTNGKYAYFSSNQDIWLATPLPEIARPLPTRTVSGRLVDFNNKPVTDVSIIIRSKSRGDTVSILKPDPQSGDYAIVLPDNDDFEAVILDKKGDYFQTTVPIKKEDPSVKDNIPTASTNIQMFRKQDVDGKGVDFKFQNLNFDFKKAEIKPDAFAELDRWVKVILENHFKASIEGHTDNVGSDEQNLTLSQQRADAVRNYLISKGCAADAIQAKGFGKKKQLVDNSTDANRALNRRVEIKVRKE